MRHHYGHSGILAWAHYRDYRWIPTQSLQQLRARQLMSSSRSGENRISSFSHTGRRMEMTQKASREFTVTTSDEGAAFRGTRQIRFTYKDILEPIGPIYID